MDCRTEKKDCQVHKDEPLTVCRSPFTVPVHRSPLAVLVCRLPFPIADCCLPFTASDHVTFTCGCHRFVIRQPPSPPRNPWHDSCGSKIASPMNLVASGDGGGVVSGFASASPAVYLEEFCVPSSEFVLSSLFKVEERTRADGEDQIRPE